MDSLKRKWLTRDQSKDEDHEKKKRVDRILKLLQDVDSISITPINKKSEDIPQDESGITDYGAYTDVPDDMVVKRSMSITANFDLRPLMRVFNDSTASIASDMDESVWSEFLLSRRVWVYPPNDLDSSRWKHVPALPQQALDTLWTTKRAEEGQYTGGGGARAAAIERFLQWQDALESVSQRLISGSLSFFYILGLSALACRALLYRSSPDAHVECILQRCTPSLYLKISEMGVTVKALETVSSSVINGPLPMSALADKVLLISGEQDVRATLDCILSVSLSLSTLASFGRRVGELPRIVAPREFLHASISTFNVVSYSKTPSSQTSASATKMEGRTLQISGLIPSACIGPLTKVLKHLANSSSTANTLLEEEDDIDQYVVLSTGSNKRDTEILPLSDTPGLSNPFRLRTRKPMKSITSLPSSSRADTERDRSSSTLSFDIKLNSALYDTNFSYCYDILESERGVCGDSRSPNKANTIDERKGLICTAVNWKEEMSKDNFEITKVLFPSRVAREIEFHTDSNIDIVIV